jgi:sporulation protein YlmC with PRC-barrel domain
MVSALAIGTVLVGPAWAVDVREAQIARSSDVIGMTVQNNAGEDLGKISDIVVDTKDGRVVYFALRHGATLGLGGKLFAVAPEVFAYDPSKKVLGFNETKENLDKMAGFDANSWPPAASPHWGKKEGTLLKQDAEGRSHARRISALVGYRIKNNLGEDLGKIYDFALDMTHHRVAYAVLAYGALAGVRGKLFPIAWQDLEMDSLTLRPNERTFILHATKEDFKDATGFDNKSWPTAPDRRFSRTGKEGKR